MEKTLEEKVKKLSPEDKATFDLLEALPREKVKIINKEILDRVYTRSWCEDNGIDYTDPDMLQTAIYAYRELIKEGKI